MENQHKVCLTHTFIYSGVKENVILSLRRSEKERKKESKKGERREKKGKSCILYE